MRAGRSLAFVILMIVSHWLAGVAHGIDIEEAEQRAKRAVQALQQHAAPQTPEPAQLPADMLWREHETQYQTWRLAYLQHIYFWHFCAGVAIFFLVAGIVLFGLWLSYAQFRKDILSAPAPVPVGRRGDTGSVHDTGEGTRPASTFKVGLRGIEVNSSIIGLLILVLSLAFLYLYLTNVYPVFDRLPSPTR